MTFLPGRQKTGGSVAGTKELKGEIRKAMIENFPRFMEELNKQHGASYTKTYIDALKFVLPTVSSVQFADEKTESSMQELIRSVAEYHK